jgi:hypothetical protein
LIWRVRVRPEAADLVVFGLRLRGVVDLACRRGRERVRLDLHVEGALRSIWLRALRALARVVPVFLLGVVGADGERDRRGLRRLLAAVVLVEELGVLDRLVFLTEAEAEHDGVLEGLRGLVHLRVLSRANRSYQRAASS